MAIKLGWQSQRRIEFNATTAAFLPRSRAGSETEAERASGGELLAKSLVRVSSYVCSVDISVECLAGTFSRGDEGASRIFWSGGGREDVRRKADRAEVDEEKERGGGASAACED